MCLAETSGVSRNVNIRPRLNGPINMFDNYDNSGRESSLWTLMFISINTRVGYSSWGSILVLIVQNLSLILAKKETKMYRLRKDGKVKTDFL